MVWIRSLINYKLILPMKRTFILFLFSAIILQSCSPKIRTNLSAESQKPLDSDTEILVIKQDESLPENSQFIGDLKVGDSGFSTDCGYSKVIDDAKKTARKSGANLIYLTEVKKPNLASTCYRIKAKLYKNLNSEVITQIAENRKAESKSRLPADADYAMVYFYRPNNFSGSLIGYKVRMNEEDIIGRVRNGEKFGYKVTDFGKHEFWAKTESKSTVIIDVEPGEEYFVRCGINMGFAVGKPDLTLVDNELGISEYESIKEK